MNAPILLAVFLGLVVLFVLVGHLIDRANRRAEMRRYMRQASAHFQELEVAIGEGLIPAVNETIKAFQSFADAIAGIKIGDRS